MYSYNYCNNICTVHDHEELAYTTFCGSFLLFTGRPLSHFSFFLPGNCVDTNLELAWVGRISHQGASAQRINLRGGGGQRDYLGAFVIQFRVGEGWIKGESIQILLNSINNAEMWNWNWKSINKGRRLTP